jgi:hypothetical protein
MILTNANVVIKALFIQFVLIATNLNIIQKGFKLEIKLDVPFA